jgi:hypothetical protein
VLGCALFQRNPSGQVKYEPKRLFSTKAAPALMPLSVNACLPLSNRRKPSATALSRQARPHHPLSSDRMGRHARMIVHGAMVCIKTDHAHHVRSDSVRVQATATRHSAVFKPKLVDISLVPGASVAGIALEHEINANMLFGCPAGAGRR